MKLFVLRPACSSAYFPHSRDAVRGQSLVGCGVGIAQDMGWKWSMPLSLGEQRSLLT